MFVELNHVFTQLKEGLSNIESRVESGATLSEEDSLRTINFGWEIIDIVYRVRGLLGQIKGLKQNTPELQIFYRAIEAVEGFRHFYQHLNSEIPLVSEGSGPVLGYLSWRTRNPKLGLTVAVGTLPKGTQMASLAWDRVKNEIVDETLFVAGTLSIDLKVVTDACVKIEGFFNGWLDSKGFLGKEESRVSTMKWEIRI